jgi:hypothetical protein
VKKQWNGKWKVVSHLFVVVWFCFNFLDAMKFSFLLSLLRMFVGNQSLAGSYNNQSLPSSYKKKLIIVEGNQ